ncbi:hypothetical protein MNBD_GAMMA26-522 [hydrothermal vent metagenome]|uniref:SH3b domain-containing protein n=1 Tax=hydrothermal vent metagenome TaxID=652676 RepID=A0A3B1AX14_9ZZZZ
MNKTTLALLLLLSSQQIALAETYYVTDQSKVMLRTGEDTSHKIVRTLPSGYSLEVLNTNLATGYSKVRTQDGSTGHILTHQLMDTPSARERLPAIEAEIKALKEANKKLSQDADAALHSKDRTALRQNVAVLTRKVADLQQENLDLHNQGTRNWFLIGAGVIIAGILIGLILPRLNTQRRKDSWGSL